MIRSVVVAGLALFGTYATAKYGWPIISDPAFFIRATESAKDAAPRASPPAILAPEPEPWTGVLLTDALDLTARIDSRVKSFAFRVGDQVRAGDEVAVLDTTNQEHDIAAAVAALRASQAEAWRAGVSVTQARDREHRRAKVFHVGGAEIPLVSKEELADSKFDSLTAGANAGAVAASVDERKARLASLRQIVHDSTIRAPFDGFIATRYVESGATIRQGMPVVRVVGRGALRVRFAVPEAEATAIALQMHVTTEVDGRALQATIDRIAPEVESASSSVVMEALVDSALPSGDDRSALAGRVVAVRRAP